jgi:predicted KAP-like P-loop ATPase
MATNIYSDTPIKEVTEDKFGRRALVELLAKSIQEKCKSDHDSICIGIYGKWGEGKTSFVNMLSDLLNTTYKSHNADIVLFNPWIVNSEEGLIREYFKRIVASPIGESFKKSIIEYGGLIAAAASEVGGELFPVIGPLVKASINATRKYLVSRDKSLEELKSNISDNLLYNKEHLLVFIDDIDRLDCDEMHLVFRLVRQVADFKNTIYILSLDENRVSKSLGKYYGEGGEEDGRQFLEKIIQIPIVLPRIQVAHIKKSLKEAIVDVYRSIGLDIIENVDDIIADIEQAFANID